MRVAIVHDDLVQWGGAERVLEGLCDIYPDAPIFTSVFDEQNKELVKRFGSKKVITSFLQKIPRWKYIYKAMLPLYPIAFEQFDFSSFDLVISHTTRFAKVIITKPQTKHICFCHTPPRFLWNFSSGEDHGMLKKYFNYLRYFDQISSKRVDNFIAGSKNARQRIKKVYGVDSHVVYPFVDLNRFKNIESFDGGYFVTIARPNKYKRIDLAKKACQKIGADLKIIDGKLDDQLVAKVLSGARALIVPGIEDFGLVSLEAQALGKGVVAFKRGGSLETIIEEKTGIFFKNQSVDDLVSALKKLDSIKIDPQDCRENAKHFSKENFVKNFQQTVALL